MRTDEFGHDVCVLFELIMVVSHSERTESKHKSTSSYNNFNLELFEISCGWGLLPVFSAEGNSLNSRTYEIRLHGGIPFTSQSPLKSNENSHRSSLWAFTHPVEALPRLTVKVLRIATASRLEIRLLRRKFSRDSDSRLPPTIIVGAAMISTLARVREAFWLFIYAKYSDLGSKFRYTLNTSPKQSSCVALCLKILDFPDLFDLLKEILSAKMVKIRRTDKV